MSLFNKLMDSGDECGHCKACRWWQAEREGTAADDAAIGLCMHQELTHFSIQVSGHSGCNRFEQAEARELASAISGV